MLVARNYDVRSCDNCEREEELWEVSTKDGIVVMRLCRECLLELLKAIVERD